MKMKLEIDKRKIDKSLSIKDLTDQKNGIHAINLVVSLIVERLNKEPGFPKAEIRRVSPVTSVANNFDRLLFPEDNLSRSSVYTRYVDNDHVLRTHSSAMIPDILGEISITNPGDYLVVCPGICYRRDVVDKKHCGEPHQMDVWIIKKGDPRLLRADLINLIELVIDATIPGTEYRANEMVHPYTVNGLEVEVLVKGEWIEILECGEAHPAILDNAGLDAKNYSGLAMGIGLDRLVMIIKNIDDIRILRAEDPRIKKQMDNLNLYKPVSKLPPISQDMSFSVNQDDTEEDVCESIRDAMEEDIDLLEEVKIISMTKFSDLPTQAIARLGIKSEQKNILARIILRSHERSLLKEEANEIRDRVYNKVNQSGTSGYLKASE
jgi:phenylalanyl-tRNA synthetase alpha chain